METEILHTYHGKIKKNNNFIIHLLPIIFFFLFLSFLFLNFKQTEINSVSLNGKTDNILGETSMEKIEK